MGNRVTALILAKTTAAKTAAAEIAKNGPAYYLIQSLFLKRNL
jgi:hypothetical protein